MVQIIALFPFMTFFCHFKNLNQNVNINIDSFDPRTVDHSINTFINDDISLDEVLTARNQLKNKKTCGTDNIINEFIKYCPDRVLAFFVNYLMWFLTQDLFPVNGTLVL